MENEPKIRDRLIDAIDNGVYLRVRMLTGPTIDWKDVCSWTELPAVFKIVVTFFLRGISHFWCCLFRIEPDTVLQ